MGTLADHPEAQLAVAAALSVQSPGQGIEDAQLVAAKALPAAEQAGQRGSG